jgi:hypothetical protein
MKETGQKLKKPIRDKKPVDKPFFLLYRVSCVNEEKEQIDLEISPFALLIAAGVISENTESSIEQGLADAMVNIMESIEAQYTILGFK